MAVAIGKEEGNGFGPIFGDLNLVRDVVLAERPDGHLRVTRVVFDQQDFDRRASHTVSSSIGFVLNGSTRSGVGNAPIMRDCGMSAVVAGGDDSWLLIVLRPGGR